MSLKDELINDPLEVGYAAMTDEEVAASLNTKNRNKVGSVTANELLAWAGGGAVSGVTKSRYERLEDGKGSSSTVIRGVCKTALQLLTKETAFLDLTLADRIAMVDALVAGSIISSAERDEIYALATTVVSRAEELGIGRVKVGHVQEVRRGIN